MPPNPLSATDPAPPGGPRLTRGTLVAACVAIGVAQIGVVFIAPMLGEIQRDLGASAAMLAWLPAAFILPTAVLELTFGVLGDLFGRKRLMVGGGILLLIGDLISLAAGSLPTLIAGQAVAGLGAAAVFPASLALLVAATPDSRDRARALSARALSLAFGAMISPLISGFVAEHASWNVAFVVPAVFAVATTVISALLIVDSRRPEGRAPDWPGQILGAVFLVALLYAVIQGSAVGFGEPSIIAGFLVSLAALVRAHARRAVRARGVAPRAVHVPARLRLSRSRSPAGDRPGALDV